MSTLLRSLLSQHVMRAESPEGGDPGEGGEQLHDDALQDGEGGDVDGGEGGDDKASPPSGEASEDPMLKAIAESLKPKTENDGSTQNREPAKKGGDAPGQKEAEEAAKAEEKKQRDALEKVAVKDLMLSLEERKALSHGANRRFHQLHRKATMLEEQANELRAVNERIVQARDTIVNTMREHKVESSEDLLPLLEFNLALKGGDYAAALEMVEKVRADIMTAMGKEGPGVDLLKDFPDLSREVQDEQMSRERALEIAQARRERQQREAHAERARARQEEGRTQQQAREDALSKIEQWEATLKSDPLYPQKSKILSAELDDVVKSYPPGLWLKAMQDRYARVTVAKQQTPPPGPRNRPLRPSGLKPGGEAPKTMGDAITAALGYDGMSIPD